MPGGAWGVILTFLEPWQSIQYRESSPKFNSQMSSTATISSRSSSFAVWPWDEIFMQISSQIWGFEGL